MARPVGRAAIGSPSMRAPLAAMRCAEPAGQAIVDPARLRLAALGPRDDDPEGRLAGGEIARAVDRVDDPAGRIEPVEYAGIRMRRLLADEGQRAIDRGEAFAQQGLAVPVGDGHRIVAALVLDLACGKIAVARQDRPFGGAPHQREDFLVERRCGRGHER